MSQSGILDIEQSHPQVPTLFNCDSGSAIPILNELVVDGLTVANATYSKPVFTTGSGNTVDVNVQVGTARTGSPADSNDAGIVSFDDTMFTVDSNGFVQLAGGTIGLDSLTGDDGTVVTADGSGNINILGSTVANGTNVKPLYIDGNLGTNTLTADIQVAVARTGAPGDKLDAGICSFDDTAFSVDADGYVTLAGGAGPAVDTNTGDDSVAVTPDGAGNFNWLGVAVANATHAKPIYFKDSATANALDLDVQVGAAITGAPGDKNDAGLCSFDDTYFTVDTDGYVSQTQAGIDTATANYIVDPNGTKAEYTTIASAYAAAPSGSTIFFKEGTYAEDLIITKDMQFVGFTGESRNYTSVTLNGKLTFSGNYSIRIQGIRHETNGDNLLDFNGNDANVWYENCTINIETAITGFVVDGTASTGNLYISNCMAAGTGTAKFFDMSGTGQVIWIMKSWLEYFTTASTLSSGTLDMRYVRSTVPLTISGSGRLLAFGCTYGALESPFTNVQFLTMSSSNASTIRNCYISSGTATAITVTSGTLNLTQSTIQSTNGTAAIDGAGTLVYGGLTFSDSSTITTTTQTIESEGPSRTIGSSKTAGTNTLQVQNTDNTDTGSHAQLTIDAGGTSGGDPFVRWNVPSGQDYSMGIDNSDSDKLTITDDANPSTGNVLWEMTSAGERTMPLQPAFLATHTIAQNNITGNGTLATINFTNEVFDQNSDYDGTNTFTAPVTGIYSLTFACQLSNVAGGTGGQMRIAVAGTSAQTYLGNQLDYSAIADASGIVGLTMTILAKMTASDTAKCQVYINGIGADTADAAATPEMTYFSGHLVC